MELKDTQNTFIRHWGEMGSRWGINRAIGEVHGFLLAAGLPCNAQTISETLLLSRSNVSTSLKELQSWELIKLVHLPGDRREYFEADRDPWSVFSKIAKRRMEREILPTITLLSELQQVSNPSDRRFETLIKEFKEFLEAGVGFYRRIYSLPVAVTKRLLKFESKIEKLLRG